jgi:PilZ domain
MRALLRSGWLALTKKTETPAQGIKMPSGVHAMRRGGARREVTERVTLKNEQGATLEGWALNVSRGGLRAILEEKVVLGQKFDVAIGTDEVLLRPSRVVWVQEEPDGVIVGLEFTGLSGTHKSAPPPPPPDEADATPKP